MASMNEKYDSALIGILQNEGQIAKFLDALLGFLYRRTDFYRIMKTEKDSLGFPPGVALKLMTNIFKKYENMAAADEVKRQQMLQEKASQSAAYKTDSPREIEAGRNKEQQSVESTQGQQAKSPAHEESVSKPVASSSDSDRTPSAEHDPTAVGDGNKMEVDTESDDKQKDGEEERLQRVFQANPESYNGAVRDNYSWSQSITDTDVRVKVPESIRKGKDVKVDIKKKSLHVQHRNSGGEMEEVLSGDLVWEVRPEECMWTLSPGQHIHINLEKKEERWWEALLVNEPKINTRKIDCSRPMTDLDDEAQAKIEEMMYNERQKRLGLPQSHEQKPMDMLRQAWDAEGSPFKGQPFDPSALSIDPSGVVNIK